MLAVHAGFRRERSPSTKCVSREAQKGCRAKARRPFLRGVNRTSVMLIWLTQAPGISSEKPCSAHSEMATVTAPSSRSDADVVDQALDSRRRQRTPRCSRLNSDANDLCSCAQGHEGDLHGVGLRRRLGRDLDNPTFQIVQIGRIDALLGRDRLLDPSAAAKADVDGTIRLCETVASLLAMASSLGK
jgi:hypothetical protein